jgi:retinol dehydrogenase-14
LTSIYLASSPEVEGISGKYFDKCRPIPSTPLSYDLDVAVKLWEVSQELTAAKVTAAVL